ncbi:MAG TPA: hypothetical protein VF047_07110 [Nitrososphaeraceae archaeon]
MVYSNSLFLLPFKIIHLTGMSPEQQQDSGEGREGGFNLFK